MGTKYIVYKENDEGRRRRRLTYNDSRLHALFLEAADKKMIEMREKSVN